MSCNRWAQVLAGLVTVFIGCCSPGCAAGQRNLTEAVIVTAPPSLADSEVKIVIESRDAREEFRLSDADGFLASDRAAKLSHTVRTQVRQRCHALRRTLAQARDELSDGLAIVRPDAQRPYADGNVVVYIAGESDIRVLFSLAEMAQLLAFKELDDDLATLRYTHPAFDSTRLRALRDRVCALGLKVENTSLSKPELDRLKAEAATRILEYWLRENGVVLSDDAPLLISGPFASPRSPKLTEALRDPAVVEQLLRSPRPDALRALVFLADRKIIDLDYP